MKWVLHKHSSTPKLYHIFESGVTRCAEERMIVRAAHSCGER